MCVVLVPCSEPARSTCPKADHHTLARPRRKITEPKTPFVQYDALNDMVLSGPSTLPRTTPLEIARLTGSMIARSTEVPGFDLGTLNGQSTADVLASPSKSVVATHQMSSVAPGMSTRRC